MTDLQNLFRSRHGVVRAADLLDAGLTRQGIRRLTDAGALVRLRPGWYADPWTADPHARDAVAAGGVLTCVSALAKRGIWTPVNHRLHLRRSEHHVTASPLPRHADWMRRHWVDWPAKQSVDSIGVALHAAVRCVAAENLVAILDSVLCETSRTVDDLAELFADSLWLGKLLSRCDGKAESGTESLVRFRLASRRLQIRSQVWISEVGRVDLLIGRRLVIEVDSRAYHTGEEAYGRDRRRDRKLVRLGYLVIRLTYEEVMYRWKEVADDILAIVQRGDHLRQPAGHPRANASRSANFSGYFDR